MWIWGSHDRMKLDEDGQQVGTEACRGRYRKRRNYDVARVEWHRKFDRLCKRYGKKPATVKARMRCRPGHNRQMTLREALRTPVKTKPSKEQQKWNGSRKLGDTHEL